MKRIASLLSLMFLLGHVTAHAQSDLIIKQRAKGIRDANNAQQGVPPPAAPAPAPAAPAVPPPPAGMSAEQKALVDKLEADLTAIKPGATNLTDHKQTLTQDFSTLVKGGIKPSPTSLTKLAADLSAALSGNGVSGREQGQLAKAINVVMNSGNVSPAQAQVFVTTAQTSLKSSNVGDTDLKTVTDDLKAIVAELQKSKPKLYQ